jgi:hypothetical protein
MEWDVIVVFVLALLFFESLAYLMLRKSGRQKLGVVKTSTLNKTRETDTGTERNLQAR